MVGWGGDGCWLFGYFLFTAQFHKPYAFFSLLTDSSTSLCPQIFRVAKQRLREARIQVIDYLILLLAGACLGSIAKVSDETFGALGYTYTIIAVCKLTKFSLT